MLNSDFDHDAWQERLKELRSQRDTDARVCASFVNDDNWKLAKVVAARVEETQALIRVHLELLPRSEPLSDAD